MRDVVYCGAQEAYPNIHTRKILPFGLALGGKPESLLLYPEQSNQQGDQSLGRLPGLDSGAPNTVARTDHKHWAPGPWHKSVPAPAHEH